MKSSKRATEMFAGADGFMTQLSQPKQYPNTTLYLFSLTPPHYHRLAYIHKTTMENHNNKISRHESCMGDNQSSSNEDSKEEGIKAMMSVRFNQVTIREYNRTIGDNPACAGGAPPIR